MFKWVEHQANEKLGQTIMYWTHILSDLLLQYLFWADRQWADLLNFNHKLHGRSISWNYFALRGYALKKYIETWRNVGLESWSVLIGLCAPDGAMAAFWSISIRYVKLLFKNQKQAIYIIWICHSNPTWLSFICEKQKKDMLQLTFLFWTPLPEQDSSKYILLWFSEERKSCLGE